MEQAVEIMRQSVAELRHDDKVSPKVGVVLWKQDGTVDTACRGELRDGDHAEYTLLERKNGTCKLDCAILFSTLEPCAPGSRSHPKIGCAERIVLARIKEVWIGIEDSDPTVDRKGIKYLQDSGVTVHMFDRDLQEEIKAANSAFIEQAEERAAEVRVVKQPIMLSDFEGTIANAEMKDLSKEALEEYRKVAKIPDKVGSPAFNRRLVQQGLLKEEHGKLTPTGFGMLLFGKEPRSAMPQAGLLGTIHFPEGTEELKDFDGPQIFAPEQALRWLRDKLPNPIDRTKAQRQQANESVFELVREGVVNALVHRDYSIEGAKCHLIVTSETITVKSPGMPIEPITLKEIQSFNAPMLSRNPIPHFVFSRMELAEERGLGLKSLKIRAEAAGLPLPRYTWQPPYLVLTIYRTEKAAVKTLPANLRDRLTQAEMAGWQWLSTKERITTSEYETAMGIPNRTAKNHIKKLVDLGLLQRRGSGPATFYEVVRP